MAVSTYVALQLQYQWPCVLLGTLWGANVRSLSKGKLAGAGASAALVLPTWEDWW